MLSHASIPVKSGRKKLFTALIGGFTGAALYGSFYQYTRYSQSSRKWAEINENLSKFEPVELYGPDLKVYPWYRNNNVSEWEYKLVKIRGYFKDERFFVRRAKDGKEGYLVFAPFITAIDHLDFWKTSDANPPREHGLLVNVGWVPLENKRDVELGGEIVPPLSLNEQDDLPGPGLFTNMQKFDEENNPLEDDNVNLTEITGIVRRGEEQDILRGRRNWPGEGVFNYIDLQFMTRFFRLYNLGTAKEAYIERVVPSFDEGEGLYPVPATKDTLDKPYLTPSRHLNYSLFWGSASLLGAASLLIL